MRINKLPSKLGRALESSDSANVAIGLRNHGLALDYAECVGVIRRLDPKARIIYYGPKFIEAGHQRFLGFLKKLGLKLRTKEVKVIRDGGEDHRKANFDVELAVDVIDLSKTYDTLLLLSGDSDFVVLVRYLHQKGKKTFVLSTGGSVAKELVDESDGYLVLNEWKKVVRPYRKNPPAVKRGN